jgi:DNA polymerase-3 subunit gamma/tau
VSYQVFARKYRPQTFDDLVGQEHVTRTLKNAVEQNRLAHAYLFVGPRGIGKTSSARILAKALNCIHGPTTSPCGVCDNCKEIAAGNSLDVLEIDGASNNGVEQVRELRDNVRYAPAKARYKIYIIDEVHMLSKNAFNALLKTLEEPPPHVKFLFATTEVQKVPVTVLSRCQRFDLRRIPAELLAEHFVKVTQAERVEAEPEALALIARAAEGSARDGLSILDQAIAHGHDHVTAAQVREMLGLSDRGAIRALFAHLLNADAAAALAALGAQHDLGVDPVAVFRGLLETCHGVTRAKAGGGTDAALSAEEQEAFADWASGLGFAALHRLWQLLLKGHGEVVSAPMPLEAAEMALLRIVHASSLPDPGELARRLASGQAVPVPPAASAPPPPMAEEQQPLLRMPPDFKGLIALLESGGKYWLAQKLHDAVGLVRYAPPDLVIRPTQKLEADFARELAAALKIATSQPWSISIADGPSEPSLLDQEKASAQTERDSIMALPVVQAAFEAFPEAELIEYSAGSNGA